MLFIQFRLLSNEPSVPRITPMQKQDLSWLVSWKSCQFLLWLCLEWSVECCFLTPSPVQIRRAAKFTVAMSLAAQTMHIPSKLMALGKIFSTFLDNSPSENRARVTILWLKKTIVAVIVAGTWNGPESLVDGRKNEKIITVNFNKHSYHNLLT